MKRRQAFTLTELLVVISILALLAGLLMPVIGRVRGASKRSACTSNLRQVGVALRLYLDQSSNLFPSCCTLPSNPLGLPSITATLAPYGATPQLFRCPADLADFQAEGTSYAWNELLNGGDAARDPLIMDLPVMSDYRRVHGEGPGGMNHLFRDGSVHALE